MVLDGDSTRPVPRRGDFGQTPFARLALAQAASVMGDACVTVALAGSLFFTIPTGSARPKVLLYLLLTVAPFSIVAPVIGPLLDRSRGGRRLLMAFGMAGRAVVCILMAREIHGLLLFPLAFGVLVLSKGHSVAKSSLVPAVVRDEAHLVRANARLALISVVASFVGAAPAAGLLKVFGAGASLWLGAVVFVGGALLATRIPRGIVPPPAAETVDEREELHRPSILLARTAMAVMRGAVGFLTFLVAFSLKRGHEPAWYYGAVLLVSGAGGLVGILLAPLVRRRLSEEVLLGTSLLVPAVALIFAARWGGDTAYLLGSAVVALGTAAARPAFDSLVQRDGPDEIRGRAFARFETAFQVAWVVGALIPVALFDVMRLRVGLFVLALVLGGTALSYFGSYRAARQRPPRRVVGLRERARMLRRRTPSRARHPGAAPGGA